MLGRLGQLFRRSADPIVRPAEVGPVQATAAPEPPAPLAQPDAPRAFAVFPRRSPWARSSGLAELDRRFGLDERVALLRRGEAPLDAGETHALRSALMVLTAAELKQLREAFVERPPHPRLREMRSDPALVGPPTHEGVFRLFTGEALGLRPRSSPALAERAEHILAFFAKSKPEQVPVEERPAWIALLAQSEEATCLLENQGPRMLPAITALGVRHIEEIGSSFLYVAPLALLGEAGAEKLAEARAYGDRHGSAALKEALGHLGDIAFGGQQLVARAFADGSFEDAATWARLLCANAGARRSLEALYGQEAILTRLLGRPAAEQERELADAKAAIPTFGTKGVPMLAGAAWPAPRARTPAITQAEAQVLARAKLSPRTLSGPRAELPTAALGAASWALKAEIARRRPDLAALLQRELQGRRFISASTYDKLYELGIKNPEEYYSRETFASYRAAEQYVRSAADASRGRPLEEGELSRVMCEAHRRVGQGMVAIRESHLVPEDLGVLRSTREQHVQLGDALIPMDKAVSALLDRNPYLSPDQGIIPTDGKAEVVRTIHFARGDDVPRFVAELDAWVRAHEDTLSAEALAAEVHWRLVSIHPFMDANGRTSKLVVDFLLMRKGLEPPLWRQRDVLKDVDRWPKAAREGLEAELAVVERYFRAAVEERPVEPRPTPQPKSERGPAWAP